MWNVGSPRLNPKGAAAAQGGAGTARQLCSVPGSGAVPSPVRSPSNTLCAALGSVGNSPEHSRKTSGACQERVFREDFPAVLHHQRRALTCGISEGLTGQGGGAPGHPLLGTGCVGSCGLPEKGKLLSGF